MRRKKWFKTRTEAKRWLKDYVRTYVTEPAKDEMRVFKLRGRYFLGTPFEYDCERWS